MKKIYRWWPVAGGLTGLLLGGYVLTRLDVLRAQPDLFFWLFLALLMLHHVEEFVLPGGLQVWLNRFVLRSKDPARPFTDGRAFANDVLLGWGGFVVAALVGTRLVWATLAPLFVIFFDAWFHISYTMASGRYSPGTVTALALIVPVTSYAVLSLIQWDVASYGELAVAATLGLAATWGYFLALRRLMRRDADT